MTGNYDEAIARSLGYITKELEKQNEILKNICIELNQTKNALAKIIFLNSTSTDRKDEYDSLKHITKILEFQTDILHKYLLNKNAYDRKDDELHG